MVLLVHILFYVKPYRYILRTGVVVVEFPLTYSSHYSSIVRYMYIHYNTKIHKCAKCLLQNAVQTITE